MANELEQRATEHLLAYLTHLHPEHDEAAYNAVTETVAALQQAQQPDPMRELRAYKRGLEDAQQPVAQAVGYVSPHVVEHLRSGGHSCTTITSHRAMLDDVALYTATPPLPLEPEPDLDERDPKSGELVAQWLFRNGFHELAAVVRAQLDMRAPRKATPPLPEGVREEDVEAAAAASGLPVRFPNDRKRVVDALESYRARLAANGGM